MRVLQGKGKPILTVICGVHGDERLGFQVWRSFVLRKQLPAGLCVIVANEVAGQRRVRFVETDLNRSFPGKLNGSYEERLAGRLVPYLRRSRYVIDIHQTTSELDYVAITPDLCDGTRKILNATTVRHIILIGPAKFSLIGNVTAGVSLEFGRKFAGSSAEVQGVMNRLLNGVESEPAVRSVYHGIGTIPLGAPVPASSRNFHYIKRLGGYPLLLRERAYRQQHQGFIAKHRTRVVL